MLRSLRRFTAITIVLMLTPPVSAAVPEAAPEVPELREIAPGHAVRCHLSEDLDLLGMPS